MLQHDVLAVTFFPAAMPDKSSGLFKSLEADLLQSQMPDKSSSPRNATFYIPPGARPGVPPGGQTFMAWRNVKCLIPGTRRLFWR
jgi:hypothetical protein